MLEAGSLLESAGSGKWVKFAASTAQDSVATLLRGIAILAEPANNHNDVLRMIFKK